ncbi:MAG: hypothetical protein PWQ52_1475 [Methanolobus sp.]|jgi:hypothetical protein|nr:hypothetical protein [Methanolobus sp.]MDK2833299.1 hypothetical protein [Methanolobus sp.]
MKNKETLSGNEKAFSSNMDSLIFLLLISISAVILMPAVMAEYQYRSAGYVSLQDTDTLVLSSMLNSRIDEVGYTYKPGELVGLNISLPQDSMLRMQKRHFMEDNKSTVLLQTLWPRILCWEWH